MVRSLGGVGINHENLEGGPTHRRSVQRPDEHLPPPTGRDIPPRGTIDLAGKSYSFAIPTQHAYIEIGSAEQGGPTERLTTVRDTEPAPQFGNQAPQPLAPAPGSRTVVDNDPWATPPSAGDTLGGFTSKDAHSGIGMPTGGMSSSEMHHDGKQHRKRGLHGTDQYGTASGLRDADGADFSGWKEE